ncbi:MAG: metalloregulator ArsR/SmtB family transcription factor [Gammaproteobacteria bacterium]|nr:metalloregulator ArsR/SmtB family transcription factor [Gammaproteobacteria bacterium]
MDTISLANLFKSLSEPVRLRIIWLLLEKGELCVCELVDALELSQSVVSRHLAYLRNNQLVSAKREGAWMYYKINPQTPIDMTALFQFMSQCSKSNPELAIDQERLNKNIVNQCNK